MDRFDYLIVGAGFAGSVCAERLASAGKSVLLIDQRNHIGGNAYDYYDDAGILVHKYGPHIFHTNSKAVFDYLSRFTEWRPYEHRVVASVNGQLLPVPINRTTLAAFGGDEQAAIDAIYRPYTRKQWGCEIEDLDPSVLARVKVRDSDDDRYFTDAYQYMPLHGYTKLFEKLTAHPNIKILLKTSYVEAWSIFGDRLDIDNAEAYGFDVVWTGPIDEYFGCCYGKLPYRSAKFEWATVQYSLGPAVINVPDERVPWTRHADMRAITGQKHGKTAIVLETPTDDGPPFWPVPKPENAALYQRYRDLARATPGVHFCGRLGTYSYINMDAAVAQALKLTTQLLAKETVCQSAE